MRTTTLSDFHAELVDTGAYRTHDDCRPAKRARPGALTTLRYTWGTLRVFPYCAVMEPLGRLTTESWAHACFHSVTAAERLGMCVSVEGFADRLAFKGPVVYLCNHMSMTETIMLPPILLAAGSFSYVAKASLAHLPFLERAAEHMRMVPISRKSPREDLLSIMRIGVERLDGGDSFLIFPQGTRCAVFSRKRYSSIGAKLAERANRPVVPIVVDTRCQPTREKGILRKVFHDFGPVDTSKDIRIAFGPVIPAGKSRDLHEAAFDWMAGRLEAWGLPVER
ncbi:MAG: 1-acyl-sn-glycerol-3-phosphate acyltransferase [Kiritimatiellae bacterium]|nr:1-acyl-sn-glycerol-3-phosphate acyltransferase [Kiritimatiellia bacterium]